MSAFATIEEFQAFWRTLTESEATRATSLLDLSSSRLRTIANARDIDLDEQAADDSDFANNLKWVVMESTKRAMLTPTDQPPVDTFSQTAGPYSENYKYSNPSGDLWFKKIELAELGLGATQTLGSISTSRTDIYSEYES